MTSSEIGALFKAARAGDEFAQRRVLDEVYPRLRALLRFQLKCDFFTADDMAQEAMVLALNPKATETLIKAPYYC